MITFTTIIQKFGQQGEKTGWTYIVIPAELSEKMKPGVKKSFRVKGKLDNFSISKVALLPMGDGNFIMPLNLQMRKEIKKQKGASVNVQLIPDDEPILPPPELLECLSDEPEAQKNFEQLTGSHRNYYIKWINGAKTDATKAKRIAHTIDALAKKKDFGAMLRSIKVQKQ
ncbi:MAG TPA: YdeI/OmpD-associated family protein [Flavisolibacter sp.]|nr:YdeI/OmpD-associated family protein [Flavisolibacter sp.]